MTGIMDRLKTLFSDEKIDTLEKAYEIVKELFATLGVKEEDAKLDLESENMLGWSLAVNSTAMYIYLFADDENNLFVKILSPALKLPEENILPFYRRLLELNLNLHDIGFGVENDTVILMAQRRIDLTTVEENKYIIEYLAVVAEKLVNSIAEEFNADKFELE